MTRRGLPTIAASVLLCALASAALSWSAPPRLEPESTLPVLDPNAAAFPASDLVDFAPTLDAPAGKHGFLFAGTDGHFYFEDGRRARFWGINVAKDAVFVPPEVIDQVVACLASAGFNLVRLHHVDGSTGLLPPGRAGTQQRIDPGKLDLLFYWVHALKERGIYVYLDLLDFREFQAAEGVAEAAKLDRAAKPAAVFNERLIELQIQYARDLLFGQPNPYTGLALGADPAVVMVEICDENGLFVGRDRWADLPPPYATELTRRWDFWLRGAYGSTDAVREAWTGSDGRSALAAAEHLEDGSIRLLPPQAAGEDFPSPTGRAETATGRAVRDRDVSRFFHSVHVDYLTEMRGALLAAGLKAPVTAVTEWENPADLLSVANTLDFVGCNWYYDHPVFAAGRTWRLPSFFSNVDPIADDTGLDLTSSVLRASVTGKPLVVREWGVCWPNKFRAAGLIEAATYGALQDIDGLILFTYNTDAANHRIEYFDVSSDPARWGIAALAGAVYRTRAVAPAQKRAVIALPTADVFSPQAALPPILYRLGWVAQLRQLFVEQTCDSSRYDLTVAGPGLSAAYPGPRVLLSQLAGVQPLAMLQRSGYPFGTIFAPKGRFVFDGLVHDQGQAVTLGASARFGVSDLQAAGCEPLGVSDDGACAVGFWDPKRQSVVLTPAADTESLRGALDVLAGQPPEGAPPAHAALDAQTYTSDTGQLTRRLRDERLILDTPSVQAFAGALDSEAMRTSSLTVRSASPLGVLIALSLDGKPLTQSETLLVKQVTMAGNTGEKKSTREAPPGSPGLKLEDFGTAPVLTHGEPTDHPTSVDLAGQPLLKAFLTNGTWEAIRKGRGWCVWCDTPSARFSFPSLGPSVQIVAFAETGPGSAITSAQPFAYPKACLFLRVLPL